MKTSTHQTNGLILSQVLKTAETSYFNCMDTRSPILNSQYTNSPKKNKNSCPIND